MSSSRRGSRASERVRSPRPPARRDWRSVVGGIGKVLIATGLLMFGFVAYQLWGTGLEYTQAQNRLESDFADLLAAAGSPDQAPTTVSAPTATTTTTGESRATTVPSASAPAPPADTVPTTAAPVATTPPVSVPDFAAGDVMALLEIPSIDVATYVVSGVQPADLKRGPGHFPDTPQPGQLGNAAIAGHRTTYGQPFFDLDELRPGDEIVVTTVQGRFVYRATGAEVVTPDRADVVATTDPSVARLTLTTCDPAYTARNRLVVYADLDLTASNAPPQEPVIAADRPATSTVPPTSVAETVPSTPSTGSVAATPATPEPTEPTEPTVPTVPATTAAPPTSSERPAAPSDALADAFAQGWFSDDAAFAQVALWGLVVTAIAVGAWLLSRRVGRNWVGALAGIAPFVVALYFFFQNVNRLLPAAL